MFAAVVGQAVRGAGRVAAHQDLKVLDVLDRDLREREVQHCLVVLRGVRARVPRPQHATQRLPGLIDVRLQRVEAIPALVIASGPFLLGMRRDQRRVDVDRQPLGHTGKLPEPLACPSVRHPQRVEESRLARDPVNRPKRRGIRRHFPEQLLLVADRAQIGHALPAIGEHHRQIPDHPARIVATTTPLQARQARAERSREPDPVSDLREQRATHVRHQTRSVRRDLYRNRASIMHHPQGEPPNSGFQDSTPKESPLHRTKPRPRSPRGRGAYCTAWARDWRLPRFYTFLYLFF
jgi:hypothetical protein